MTPSDRVPHTHAISSRSFGDTLNSIVAVSARYLLLSSVEMGVLPAEKLADQP